MREHPITRIGILLVLFRLAGLAVRYLAQTDSSMRERLALLLPAASVHAGALLALVALFLVCAKLLPSRRRTVAVVACLGFALLMVAGQADLTVSSITGAPLTPTVYRTFRGFHVVRSNEFLEPLRAHLPLAIAGVAMFATVLVLIALVIRSDERRQTTAPLSWRGVGALAGAGFALMWIPEWVPWPVPPPPIEVAFAREYLRQDHVQLRGSEQDAIRELRRVVGLPSHSAWLSDAYPLVYGSPARLTPPHARFDLPDIVVVMIESLRAEELGFVTGARDSATPNLDALAVRSAVFPAYISNGFPSAPSVLAFHSSAWPHRRKEIITDFATRGFDSIPSRLRDFGYEAIYIGADPNFDNQDIWLPRWYSKVIDLVASGTAATDRNIVNRAIEEIQQHDAKTPDKPLFEFISTYSTHYPFSLPSDAGERPLPAGAGLKAEYRQVLSYTDRHVGRLVSFLATRARHDRTITIVVGDHGFYTDLRRTSGLPENDNVWTAAIISGPEDFLGPPRRVVEPASHVDMLPTILAFVGDNRPTAALGGNLFGPPRSGSRTAFAVRPGGLRFDRDGYSVMVDARTPNIAATRLAFPGLLRPGTPPPASDVNPTRLTEWVNDWSYLIEKNRVWNESFLGR